MFYKCSASISWLVALRYTRRTFSRTHLNKLPSTLVTVVWCLGIRCWMDREGTVNRCSFRCTNMKEILRICIVCPSRSCTQPSTSDSHSIFCPTNTASSSYLPGPLSWWKQILPQTYRHIIKQINYDTCQRITKSLSIQPVSRGGPKTVSPKIAAQILTLMQFGKQVSEHHEYSSFPVWDLCWCLTHHLEWNVLRLDI